MTQMELDNDVANLNKTTTAALNSKYAIDHMVYISYLSAMTVIGVSGNVLVLFVFIFRKKPSAYRTIAINLAVTDGLVCGLVIPIEVLEKFYHFSWLSNFTCKLWITLSYFFVCSSAFIIIVLSVDRYKRVCCPLKPQLTTGTACKLIAITYALAAFCSLPNTFIWRSKTFSPFDNMTVEICVTETMNSHTDLPTIYNFSLLIVGSLMVAFLIVVYAKVMRKIVRHLRYIKTFQLDSRRESVFSITGTMSAERVIDDVSSYRITKIAFAVVIVFILSYIPSTIMKLIDTRTVYDIYDSDSVNSEFLHIFARASVYLNHIANAFIYAILDDTFRRDLVRGISCF